MGGQTALNCALELERQGVLEEFGVTMIGATADAIDKAEDRRRFDIAMKKIGLDTARSGIAHTMEEALAVAADVGFRASSVRPLPWAAPAAVSLTTVKSSKKSANAV